MGKVSLISAVLICCFITVVSVAALVRSRKARPTLYVCGCDKCATTAKAIGAERFKTLHVVLDGSPGDAIAFKTEIGFDADIDVDPQGEATRAAGAVNCPALFLPREGRSELFICAPHESPKDYVQEIGKVMSW